jgi:hypothetical protein
MSLASDELNDIVKFAKLLEGVKLDVLIVSELVLSLTLKYTLP